jgi:hypothetical protein
MTNILAYDYRVSYDRKMFYCAGPWGQIFHIQKLKNEKDKQTQTLTYRAKNRKFRKNLF